MPLVSKVIVKKEGNKICKCICFPKHKKHIHKPLPHHFLRRKRRWYRPKPRFSWLKHILAKRRMRVR